MFGWERWRATVVLGLVALVAVAGCLGISDGEQASEQVTQQSTDVEPTEATQALWEEGHKDPYLDVEPTGDVHEFEFYFEPGVINPYGDVEIGAFTFSEQKGKPGPVPNPEIRVTQGDTVRVTLHAPAHTIHWHGLDVPWSSDGVPFVTQPMGDAQEEGTYTYEFVAKQPGTYWYHCVVDFPAHVDYGMFGAVIVEPEDGPELPYDREETLFFHELDSQYFTAYDAAMSDEAEPSPNQISSNPVDAAESAKRQGRNLVDVAGLITGSQTGVYGTSEGPRDYYPAPSLRYQPSYDTFMINGKSYPDTEPVEIGAGETLRLRLINAGVMPKSIHLHGHHVLVTHEDGYKLDDPYWADTVSLSSGQRKDVYVQGTNPGIWKLHDHSGASGMGTTNANDYAFPGGMITAMVYEDFQTPEDVPGYDEGDTAGDLAVFAHPNQPGR